MKIMGFIHSAWKPLILLLLIGCASEPPQNAGVKPFPTPPTREQVLIFLYAQRHDSLKAHPTLHIDGESLVKLPHDSYTWCYVKPGPRVVRVLWGDRYASMNAHFNHDFKAGQSVFLRLTTTGGGPSAMVFRIVEPVLPEIARAQIGNSIYRRPRKDTIE